MIPDGSERGDPSTQHPEQATADPRTSRRTHRDRPQGPGAEAYTFQEAAQCPDFTQSVHGEKACSELRDRARGCWKSPAAADAAAPPGNSKGAHRAALPACGSPHRSTGISPYPAEETLGNNA
ncbi:unnamed protein product [Prorocentrum cordatum]|uniref:Uncharacterized protein n=1 Tax=Prorocentrum cordatum TaxID=2364126 RepID=A0ABN9XX26_9DINO|nr:unnamed protein product [Polarella glacialis]